jgi:hypothetical protein
MQFHDPLLEFFREINLTPFRALVFGPIVAFIGRLVVGEMTRRWNPDNYEDLKQDRTAYIFWPLLVFGPLWAAYIYIGDIELILKNGFASIASSFQPTLLFADKSPDLTGLIMVAGFGTAIYSATRWMQLREPKWLATNPIITMISISIFNFPMGYAALMLIARLLDHSTALWSLAHSGWTPDPAIQGDGAYGLDWAITVLQSDLLIILLLSFIPLVLLIRHRDLGWKNLYTANWATGIIVAVAFVTNVLLPFNRFIDNIYAHAYEGALQNYTTAVAAVDLGTEAELLKVRIAQEELKIISALPQNLGAFPIVQVGSAVVAQIVGLMPGLGVDKVTESIGNSSKTGSKARSKKNS